MDEKMSQRISTELHILFDDDVVDSLHSNKIHTILQFLDADKQILAAITKLTFKELLAVRKFLLDNHGVHPISGLSDYKNRLKNGAIIPTGLKNLDKMLQGGLLTGNIYELCGAPASGKTLFILHLIKNYCYNRKILIIDTKNDLSAIKMRQLLNDDSKLSDILIQRAFSIHDLINSLYYVKERLENDLKLRLIIIDSLPTILLGNRDYFERNFYLNELANIMRYLVHTFHIVFVITNLITTWNNGDFATPGQCVEKIACGKYWASIPNVRMKIEKVKENEARFSLLNGDAQLSSGFVNVKFTDAGFVDIE